MASPAQRSSAASKAAEATCDSRQSHAQAVDAARPSAEIATPDRLHNLVEDDAREEFGRRVASLELRKVVEVPIIEVRKHRVQHVGRAADVDDEAVSIELAAAKLDVNHIGCPVQPLCGAEYGAGEAVGDHHVAAHGDAVHVVSSVSDGRARHRGRRQAAPWFQADRRMRSRQ